MSEALVESRLTELESVIERGQQTFIEVGVALAEIRDSKLYRERFATFEDYCKDRWGWNASRSRQLIGAAEAVASMQSVTVVTQSELPSVQTERQARELAKIKDPEARAKVWQQSNETTLRKPSIIKTSAPSGSMSRFPLRLVKPISF